MNFLKKLFQKRHTYRVVLKSGAEFKITATDLAIKFRNDTMELTKYEFTDPRGEVPFHLSPAEISAIIRTSRK
jgi:hypothetical protein